MTTAEGTRPLKACRFLHRGCRSLALVSPVSAGCFRRETEASRLQAPPEAAAGGGKEQQQEEEAVEGLGHRDAKTEAEEERVRRLER